MTYTPRTLIVTLTADIYRESGQPGAGDHRLEYSASTVLAPDEDEDRARRGLARIVSAAMIGADL